MASDQRLHCLLHFKTHQTKQSRHTYKLETYLSKAIKGKILFVILSCCLSNKSAAYSLYTGKSMCDQLNQISLCSYAPRRNSSLFAVKMSLDAKKTYCNLGGL